ncbi:hypothetical protein JKP88DRAFT_347404 [Tribonema minus]|uniref:U6 snRNA phosphodiesterase 1 n=1 Tax=Tribonema minus TaxID=303371 RepID=A0A836CMF3_9STRA|nr:hypothetical protein JKP88DRAFT_347404 [Tribonema minus]
MDLLGAYDSGDSGSDSDAARSFQRAAPHERGRWPSHVHIAVPPSAELRELSAAAIRHLEARLLRAAQAQQAPPPQQQRARKRPHAAAAPPAPRVIPHDAFAVGGSSANGGGDGLRAGGGSGGGGSGGRGNSCSSGRGDGLRAGAAAAAAAAAGGPRQGGEGEGGAGGVHLSLSRPFALRAHQLEPFAARLRRAAAGARAFRCEVSGAYEVLVNDDRTRSFVCLKVVGGCAPILALIGRVNEALADFQQQTYYEDPKLHISVASTYYEDPKLRISVASAAGDITQLLAAGEHTRRSGSHRSGNNTADARSGDAGGGGGGDNDISPCSADDRGISSSLAGSSGAGGNGRVGSSSEDEEEEVIDVDVTAFVLKAGFKTFTIELG